MGYQRLELSPALARRTPFEPERAGEEHGRGKPMPSVRHALREIAGVSDEPSGGRVLPDADLVDQLGQLDDTVFDAIAGREGAMERLRRLWPAVRAAAGPALVEESREQYVRHALHVWRASVAGEELRDPAAAIAALDVVSLLFDE